MTGTHTPGPWSYEVHELSEGLSGIVYAANGMRVGTDHLSEADAALIAAAPAMLEALRPLAECEIPESDTPLPDSDSARYFITMGEIRAARAAIALATGETQ